MNIKPADAERQISKPSPELVAFLFYGPDQGLIRERAERLARTVVSDLGDPFRVSELDDGSLSSDPARLSDEAAAISMLGGRRVVRVRGASNGLAKSFAEFLDDPKGDALIIVEAGDLARNAPLRRTFEDADNAAAIGCYADNARNLGDIVRSSLKAEGLSISSEALDDAVSRLGSDRGVTRREIEKLVLYAQGKGRIELDDIRAVMDDEAEARVDAVCDAAGEGDLASLDRELERLWHAGTNAAQIIRGAIGHFQRLLQVKLATMKGEATDVAMKRGWPQIHFSRSDSFKAQINRWSDERLLDACDLLLETEALTRTTGVPPEAVTGRALFNVAAMVRAR